MKSWKSLKWDQAQNPFVTIRWKVTWSSVEKFKRQTSATIQCLCCLKRVPEGLNMCQCGVWLRPNQSTMDRIRTAFCSVLNSLLPCLSNHIKRKEKWSADGSSKSHGCKKGSVETRQRHLYTGPMTVRRSIPSVSIGTRLDGRVGQVPRLHLQDRHQSWCTLPTATTIWKQSTWEASSPINKKDHCVNDQIFNHQQMLLSVFNELKAKEYRRFQCICGQDRIKHWIPQSNNIKNGSVINWKTYLSSYSSSTWRESPTWRSSSSWDHPWHERHSQGWRDKEWWDQR